MKKSARVETVKGLLGSIEESLKEWETAEEAGKRPLPGYDIGSEHSKNSIKNHCVIARAELMQIIRDLG